MTKALRQISSKPVEDLQELCRRIVFTTLVSNKDDHLKNHGFIYARGAGGACHRPSTSTHPLPVIALWKPVSYRGWRKPMATYGAHGAYENIYKNVNPCSKSRPPPY